MKKFCIVRGVAILAAIIAPSVAFAQSFSYPDFTNTSQLQINGSASVINNGTSNVLRLTPASPDQAGSAFSLNTVALGSSASFSTDFRFQLTNGGGISDGTTNPLGADGIVFVLNTVSNSVGTLGQGVGYQGVPNSVGIKFDTWQDGVAGFPQDSDPNGNFVAIYTNGSTQTAGLDTYSPVNSMKNGDIWHAWIDYNGSSNLLEVRLADGSDVRPDTAQLSETINLSDAGILGSSPNVFAGFTSGTGGAYDNHDILSWDFNNSYQPIGAPTNNVPDATSTLGILAASLAVLAGLRRRLRG